MTNAARILIMAMMVSVTGCVSIGDSQTVRIIAPQISVPVGPDWPKVDWSLVVQRPVTDQMRGGNRIVVRSPNSRLAFYPGVAWLDELPAILQRELIATLSDSGRIAAVTRPGTARTTHALATEIRAFDLVETATGALTVELTVQASLVVVRTGDLLASRVLAVEVPADGSSLDDVTRAYETAGRELLSQVVGWLLIQPDRAPDSR